MRHRLANDAIGVLPIAYNAVNLQLGDDGRGRVVGPSTYLPKVALVDVHLLFKDDVGEDFPLYVNVSRAGVVVTLVAFFLCVGFG